MLFVTTDTTPAFAAMLGALMSTSSSPPAKVHQQKLIIRASCGTGDASSPSTGASQGASYAPATHAWAAADSIEDKQVCAMKPCIKFPAQPELC